MKFCPKCGAALEDAATFCSSCGFAFTSVAAPAGDPYDHTAEFDPKDVADNKLYAMLVYLTSVLGMVVALLAAPNSPYLQFHIRQALKLTITMAVVGFLTAVLAWTIIVPIAGGLAMLVLAVVDIICFVRVCKNRSTEAPIVCKLDFLK
ncbi:MAG: zinc-ribbon domain-containing protein [Oscillospiraceae bacterium]|nr:zinc-ribbon domain-containing protein [Oscillospiraceae bacterium]